MYIALKNYLSSDNENNTKIVLQNVNVLKSDIINDSNHISSFFNIKLIFFALYARCLG